ncbi:hypothetical protein GGR01_000774 [Acetobacter oeni]|nr:hypothetical protein [Acetobacter oeni]
MPEASVSVQRVAKEMFWIVEKFLYLKFSKMYFILGVCFRLFIFYIHGCDACPEDTQEWSIYVSEFIRDKLTAIFFSKIEAVF